MVTMEHPQLPITRLMPCGPIAGRISLLIQTTHFCNKLGPRHSAISRDVRDRWQAVSNAFNLVQNLEPYFLSPSINAPDLGSGVVTGARQGPNGRLLMAINMLDNINTIHVDLKPYRYSSAAKMARYHVAGLLSTSETVVNKT